MRMTSVLAAGASLAALTFAPAAAIAQTTPPDAAAESTSDTTDQNEIVVTAQGRAQHLADVPVAISAVNSESLKNSGANDIRQLNQLAPSLLVSSTGSEANGAARIRGIGTVGTIPASKARSRSSSTGSIARVRASGLTNWAKSTGSKSSAGRRARSAGATARPA